MSECIRQHAYARRTHRLCLCTHMQHTHRLCLRLFLWPKRRLCLRLFLWPKRLDVKRICQSVYDNMHTHGVRTVFVFARTCTTRTVFVFVFFFVRSALMLMRGNPRRRPRVEIAQPSTYMLACTRTITHICAHAPSLSLSFSLAAALS